MTTSRRRRQLAGAALASPIARHSATKHDSAWLRCLHDAGNQKVAAPLPIDHWNHTCDEYRGGGEHEHVGLHIPKEREKGKARGRIACSPSTRARTQRGRKRPTTTGIDGETL